jgi:hypothetical protein
LQQLQPPLVVVFHFTSLSLADLARQPESSTTMVKILASQVKTFAVILALLFVIKSLSKALVFLVQQLVLYSE